jgi:hypothetical protein
MTNVVVALLIGVGLYWFFILRPGRMDFWKVAARNPDAAYEHFKAAPCWKVFEEELPQNYRSVVPKSEWVGPFRLWVPRLGGKRIVVFGRLPELKQSQRDFLLRFGPST